MPGKKHKQFFIVGQTVLLDASTPKHPNVLCMIDASDVDLISKTWTAVKRSPAHQLYCEASDGRKGTLRLHQVIAKRAYPGFEDGMVVDHRNGNTLDNRRENLRLVPQSENLKNTCRYRCNKSGHNGVRFRPHLDKYQVHIGVNGKTVHGGYFDTMEQAVAAREELNKQYGYTSRHGETQCRSALA